MIANRSMYVHLRATVIPYLMRDHNDTQVNFATFCAASSDPRKKISDTFTMSIKHSSFQNNFNLELTLFVQLISF